MIKISNPKSQLSNSSIFIEICKSISKVIIFSFGFMIWGLGFGALVHADLQSTTYDIKSYDFGSGGKFGNTSTTYSLYGNTGQLDGLSLTSTTYNALPGLTYTLTTNVPSAPTITNPASYNNQLNVTLSTGGNPSDTLFAVAISPDAFVSTTKYIQADGTLGTNPVWQTNSSWGTAFPVVGLTDNTTYTIKVTAKQGTYTQSGFSPTAQAATVATTFSYSINTNSLTFPNLVAGSVQTSTANVTVTVSTTGTGGATVATYDSNTGLLSANTGYTIASASNDLSSASEGYGLQVTSVGQTSGGPMESLSPYNGTGNTVGILDSNKRNVFDSSGAAVTSGTGTFNLQAKAGNTAKSASDYADTITVIASATF